jgi:hypothetical protein
MTKKTPQLKMAKIEPQSFEYSEHRKHSAALRAAKKIAQSTDVEVALVRERWVVRETPAYAARLLPSLYRIIAEGTAEHRRVMHNSRPKSGGKEKHW